MPMLTNVDLKQVNRFMSRQTFADDKQVGKYLFFLTGGQLYGLAMADHRKWDSEDSAVENGTFYQIMPDSTDSGFFDWYCDERPYNQFFETIEHALLNFVFYWKIWEFEIKPAQ